MKKIITSFLILYSFAYATPEQIIVVRHCDKYNTQPPWSQLSLSPKGYIRAIALAKYYLKNFGQPDYMISSNAENPIYQDNHIENKYALSIKEIQTSGPLLSMLNKKGIDVAEIFYHPYKDEETTQISNFVLYNKKFNSKKILIIWDHFQIPTLIHKLGVSDSTKVTEPAEVFDNVYILQYDKDGNLSNYQEKKNQYPVPNIESWDEIYNKVITTDN